MDPACLEFPSVLYVEVTTMEPKKLLYSGIFGAVTPAIVTLCVASLGGGLLSGYLVALLIFISLSALWGTIARYCAILLGRKHSYIAAYLFGLVGSVVGQFTGFYSIQRINNRELEGFSPAVGFALFLAITAASGIVAQVLVLLCLTVIHRLTEVTLHKTTVSTHQSKQNRD